MLKKTYIFQPNFSSSLFQKEERLFYIVKIWEVRWKRRAAELRRISEVSCGTKCPAAAGDYERSEWRRKEDFKKCFSELCM